MSKSRTIAFVCLHGSAKSLIAAEHCRRRAALSGLALDATTSGPEPDPEIPGHVVEGLRADGIDVGGKRPERVSKEGLASAAYVVSFGLDLAAIAPRGVPIERWDDCPAVSDDYAIARDFIVARVESLLSRLQAPPAAAR